MSLGFPWKCLICLYHLPWLWRNVHAQGNSAFISSWKFTEYKVSLQTGFAFSRSLSGQMRWKTSVLWRREGGWRKGTNIGCDKTPQPSSCKPSQETSWVYAFGPQRWGKKNQLKILCIFIYSVGIINCNMYIFQTMKNSLILQRGTRLWTLLRLLCLVTWGTPVSLGISRCIWPQMCLSFLLQVSAWDLFSCLY